MVVEAAGNRWVVVPGNQRKEPQALEARQVVDPHARKQALRDRQRAETQELPAGGDPEPLGGGDRWEPLGSGEPLGGDPKPLGGGGGRQVVVEAPG